MNMEPRPTKEEIQKLPNSILIRKSTRESTYRATYAAALNERVMQGEINLELLDQKSSPGQAPDFVMKEKDDIRDVWRKVNDSIFPVKFFSEAILQCGWDFIDPANRVKMSPQDIKEHLEGFVYIRPNDYYRELPEGMKNILGMIFDAYGRWYMRRNRNTF